MLCCTSVILNSNNIFGFLSSGWFRFKCGGASYVKSYFIMKPRLSCTCLSRKSQLLPVSIFLLMIILLVLFPHVLGPYEMAMHLLGLSGLAPLGMLLSLFFSKIHYLIVFNNKIMECLLPYKNAWSGLTVVEYTINYYYHMWSMLVTATLETRFHRSSYYWPELHSDLSVLHFHIICPVLCWSSRATAIQCWNQLFWTLIIHQYRYFEING